MSTTNITDLPQSQQIVQQPPQPVQQMQPPQPVQQMQQPQVQQPQMQPQVTFSPPSQHTQLPASAHAPPAQHPQLTPQMQTEILSSIQNASRHGGTELPSRDIPQQTTSLVQDPQIHPNYVPPPPADYIGAQNAAQQVQYALHQRDVKLDRMDLLFEEFRIPLIIAGLYFVFSLPAVNRYIMKVIPVLFDSAGNITFAGSIGKSVLFGAYYYIFAKSMSRLSQV
jgi:hypothetical protein